MYVEARPLYSFAKTTTTTTTMKQYSLSEDRVVVVKKIARTTDGHSRKIRTWSLL